MAAKFNNRISRIVTLRRYISLLRQEEQRLRGVVVSDLSTQQKRLEAETERRQVAEKLARAEQELSGLEGGGRSAKPHS